MAFVHGVRSLRGLREKASFVLDVKYQARSNRAKSQEVGNELAATGICNICFGIVH